MRLGRDPQPEPNAAAAMMPHCDGGVLHAPGECVYCDDYPQWQRYRTLAGIAFTGHEPAQGQVPCPSDARRADSGGPHVWRGNRPVDRAEYQRRNRGEMPDGS